MFLDAQENRRTFYFSRTMHRNRSKRKGKGILLDKIVLVQWMAFHQQQCHYILYLLMDDIKLQLPFYLQRYDIEWYVTNNVENTCMSASFHKEGRFDPYN